MSEMELRATIARLTEERDRLREALRNEVVRPYSLTEDYTMQCRKCLGAWPTGSTEVHAPDCLAALDTEAMVERVAKAMRDSFESPISCIAGGVICRTGFCSCLTNAARAALAAMGVGR